MLDKTSTHPQLQPALGSNSILSIFQDREGNLWVGTETSGLEVLRQQNFRTIPNLPDHAITAITQASDGAMWIGTNGDGLDRLQAGNIRHSFDCDGLLSEIILALAPGANGSMWVGTPDGLNHIKATRSRHTPQPTGCPTILSARSSPTMTALFGSVRAAVWHTCRTIGSSH